MRSRKILFASSCLAAVVLLLNGVTLSVYGENIVDTIIQFGQGKLSFDFKKLNDNSSTAHHSVNPDNLRSEYALLSETVLIPHDLPSGFVKVQTDQVLNPETGKTVKIVSWFEKGEESIQFSATSLAFDSEYHKITNQSGDVEKKTISGRTVYLFDDQERRFATFLDQEIVYAVNTTLEKETLLQIVESMT